MNIDVRQAVFCFLLMIFLTDENQLKESGIATDIQGIKYG